MLNPCVTVKFGRILGMTIDECSTMQICRLFFTTFWNFLHMTRLFTTNHCWVINAQTGPVFLDHPVVSQVWAVWRLCVKLYEWNTFFGTLCTSSV